MIYFDGMRSLHVDIWKIGTTVLFILIISTIYKEFYVDWLKIDNPFSSFVDYEASK